MEIRGAALPSMKNIEKSVKELVTENNLRLVNLLAPHQDVRESAAGSATLGEVPEQHQDVSQPPRRRDTGVTIREPSSIPQAAAVPTQHGKGKQKLPEYPEPILQSFYENGTDFSLLDSLPIPCHLFDGDDNFKYVPSLN